MDTDQNGLGVLDRHECLIRLGRGGVGRVGFTSAALPVILPVNYAMLGEDVVFQSVRGSKFQAAMQHAIVAFEVDDVDWFGHGGWSVLAIGTAGPLSDWTERRQAGRLPLSSWVSGEVEFVRIHTDVLTGRVLSPATTTSARSNSDA